PSTGRLVVDICNEKLPAYIEGNRNVIYAGDAGRGLVMAAEKGGAGERYLFTGMNISMKELTAKIADHAGVKPPSRRLPLSAAKMIARLLEYKAKITGAKKIKLDSTAVAVMALGQFLDGTKAREELGFNGEVSLDETIVRTIEWYKKEKYIC
ncbi:MAG: epimerase, partial [Bacillota bacterium]|nr:epimerase [Bacillota bacterium]